MSNNSNVVVGGFERGPLTRLIDRIRTWNDRRVAVKQLTAMSDRLLQDIGINRHEIHMAVKRPSTYARLVSRHIEISDNSQGFRKAA